MFKKITDFIKRETVLSIAFLLAFISSFAVPPDKKYIDYIDFRTLGILFSLMAVMAGLKETGVFGVLAGKLLKSVKNIRQVMLILVLLCFFTSMLITNDVALITFVPFTFTVLETIGEKEKKTLTIPITVFQTAAANLGSMLTPIGNPQNLYLYGKSGMTASEFIMLMLPYSITALVLIVIGTLFAGRGKNEPVMLWVTEKKKISSKGKTAVYILTFLFALTAVARIVPYYIVLAVTVSVMLITDKKTLQRVDYSLLLTFVGFFVFIGNMGRIPAVHDYLRGIISGRESVTAVISSQIISNVPAALLLSGFTDNYKALIIGTNLGGLGTLIASMASLITYKLVSADEKETRLHFLGYFTVVNIVFLVIMLVFNYLVSQRIPYFL